MFFCVVGTGFLYKTNYVSTKELNACSYYIQGGYFFWDEKHQLSEITWGRGEASSVLLKVNL